MKQHSHIFERLKVVEKIRAYTTHSADCQNELSTKLETTKATEAVERKYVVEDANLLRKIKMKNDILQTKIYQLRLDIAVLGSSKARIEEEIAQLKLDLKQAESSFAKEKKKLKAAYQQQVDAVFFYGYYCCMKKHVITNDIPSIPSNEEDEAELVEGVRQGDDSGVEDISAATGHED